MSLCFLSDQLPFKFFSQLELPLKCGIDKSKTFQPAIDTREDTQQNEHEFFATDGNGVSKFVNVNDKWSQDKEATVTNEIKTCLVLPTN